VGKYWSKNIYQMILQLRMKNLSKDYILNLSVSLLSFADSPWKTSELWINEHTSIKCANKVACNTTIYKTNQVKLTINIIFPV